MLWLISMALFPLILLSGVVAAADKPAALQLCVKLPEGVALFAEGPGPGRRELANGAWMLDFDVLLDGRAPDKLTKSGPECFRAWLPARKVERVRLDFTRLPLNLVTVDQPLSVQLKADLWSDGGRLAVTRAPWTTFSSALAGTLALEREGVEVTDWKRLPRGTYVVKYTAPEPARSPCPVTLVATGVGTVRADRNPALFRELVEHYRAELLPVVVQKHKLLCSDAETAEVRLKIVDGTYCHPLDPVIVRARIEAKEPRYQLIIDGAFESGLKVEVGEGQQLELSQLLERAER